MGISRRDVLAGVGFFAACGLLVAYGSNISSFSSGLFKCVADQTTQSQPLQLINPATIAAAHQKLWTPPCDAAQPVVALVGMVEEARVKVAAQVEILEKQCSGCHYEGINRAPAVPLLNYSTVHFLTVERNHLPVLQQLWELRVIDAGSIDGLAYRAQDLADDLCASKPVDKSFVIEAENSCALLPDQFIKGCHAAVDAMRPALPTSAANGLTLR